MTKPILEVKQLKKSYGKYNVLEGVDFVLEEGRILGLLGRNGAGKTTMMKSILGLNVDHEGEIFFQGKHLNSEDTEVKSKIGSLVDVKFFEDMSGYENMMLAVSITKGISKKNRKTRINELLEFVDLMKTKDKKVKSYSFGMKQRLALAQALITEPVLLVLDEPFVGLDPVGIQETKVILKKLCKEQGTAIIFSSHQLTEVCELADDIIVLSGGVITCSDTNENIQNSGRSLVELMM